MERFDKVQPGNLQEIKKGKMKAVLLSRLYDAENMAMGDIDCFWTAEPQIENADDVKIEIHYGSICGSDINALKGYFPNKKLMNTMGHELSGVIVEMGAKASGKGLKIGDRVTGNFYQPCGICDNCKRGLRQFCKYGEYLTGGMGQYIVWKASQVFKLPDDVDMKQASLVEPLTISTHAVEIADMKIGSNVAVSGGGGIGLMIAQLAKLNGASTVTLLEPIEQKREVAQKIGVDYVFDPADPELDEKIAEITGGNGFDVIFESSGNPQAAENCLNMASVGGHLVYMSMYPPQYGMQLNLYKHCYHRELRIQGMYLATEAFPKAIGMLSRLDLSSLISGVYPLSECKAAFKQVMSGQSIKVMFDCRK